MEFRKLESLDEVQEFVAGGQEEVVKEAAIYHPVTRLGMILGLVESLPSVQDRETIKEAVSGAIRRYESDSI